jgi:hypothetical protein
VLVTERHFPDERVITRRINENAKRFSGNYIFLYLILSITYAIFMNWRILTAAIIIAMFGLFVRHFYFHVYLLEDNNGYEGLEKRRRKSDQPPSKASALSGAIAVAFVLYQFSVMTPLIMILLVTMTIASIHAAVRPFVGEHAYLLRQHES